MSDTGRVASKNDRVRAEYLAGALDLSRVREARLTCALAVIRDGLAGYVLEGSVATMSPREIHALAASALHPIERSLEPAVSEDE